MLYNLIDNNGFCLLPLKPLISKKPVVIKDFQVTISSLRLRSIIYIIIHIKNKLFPACLLIFIYKIYAIMV